MGILVYFYFSTHVIHYLNRFIRLIRSIIPAIVPYFRSTARYFTYCLLYLYLNMCVYRRFLSIYFATATRSSILNNNTPRRYLYNIQNVREFWFFFLNYFCYTTVTKTIKIHDNSYCLLHFSSTDLSKNWLSSCPFNSLRSAIMVLQMTHANLHTHTIDLK